MKTFIFLASLMFTSAFLQAQNYFSFTGSNQSSTVDSVHVLNLTQGTSLTLNGSAKFIKTNYITASNTSCPQTFTDSRDNHVYTAIQIGRQCWMAENLAYLPSVNPSNQGSHTSSLYYVYGYNGSNVTAAKSTPNYMTYGVLYNWPAAMNGSSSSNSIPSGVQGVCPMGWHLPSNAEWDKLKNYLGGEKVAFKKMKSNRGWKKNGNVSNKSGFSGLPGGYRCHSCYFRSIGGYGNWWSSTEGKTDDSWIRHMNSNIACIGKNSDDKEDGYSVRCLKD